ASYEARQKDDGSTGRAGQVIPGVARSKTTGKKLSARQTRFQPKPTKKRTPEKTQKQKASEAFDKIHKQRPDSVQKESAEAVRTSSPVPDYIDTKDQKRIYDEVSKPRTGKTGVRNALYKYFSQYRRPEDAIEAILNDSLYFDAERKASDFAHNPRQAEFYGANPDENLPSTGKTAATKALNWLRQNLRPETVQQINDRIDIPMRDAFVDLYSQQESKFTKGVAADLKAGKLEDALKTLAATLPNRNLRRIATKLSQNVGDAKVKVVDNLKAEDGRLLHGEYDPQTNTITLDTARGMTPHTLLHEMLHATTSAALAKKSHPLRRKMLDIYERAKAELGEVDGMESIDEFYAEALSNPAFQNMLQTTGGKGTPIWKQLTTAVRNAVRNMMGMSTQRADVRTGIQTEIDNLVEDLISPTIPSRDASKLYMAVKTPKDAINYINNLGPRTQKADKNYYERARDFIGGNLPKLAKEVYLKTQPLNIVAQVAKSKIAEAPLLNDLVNGMSASLRKMNTKMEPLVNDIKDFRKKNPDKYVALSRLVPYASYERVDPRATDYKSAYSGTEDKRAIYKELRKEYNALGTEGKKLYDTITNFYENSLDNVMSAINANLEATVSDGQARQRAFDKLAEQLNLTRGKIRPFSPLTRAGAYRLEYNSIDPRTGVIETFVERFETKRAREKAAQNLAEYNAKVSAKLQKSDPEKYKAVKQYLNAEPKRSMSDTVRDFRDAPPSSFVYNVLQTLNEAGVKDQQVINQIVDLALDSMPEHSFMQSFRKRRDIRGFLGDVTPTGVAETAFDLLDTVQTKGRDYNRQIVQMEYGAQIQKWKNEVNAKYSDADEELTLYKDTLFKIANFAQRPNVSRASQILTSTGYAWTMGLNFSSAAITFFDVGMSALPRMAGTYGDVAAAKALGRAAKLLAQAPRTYKVDAYGPNGEVKRQLDSGFMGASISHYDFDSKDLPEGMGDLRYLVEAGIDHAQFGQSLNQEQLDIGQSKDRLEMINKATSFLFHHAERYNREVVMTANYMLELDKLKASGKPVTAEDKRAAAIKAIDETEFTLGATASAGRPVVAQNAVGNVAFLFKRFAMSKYYMMARMFDEAFVKAIDPKDVELRSAARHSLARFLGITGLISGVGGLPMMGAMGMIYDLFASDEEDDFEAASRKVLGEGMWEGIINEALGVEVASRISMNSLLYRPPFIDKDQSQLWTLIEQLGGPVVGITLSAERGIKLWTEGEWWRGTEAVMPAAARNVLKSYRFATAGAETRRGDPIMEDVSPWNIVNQGLGFAPADYIRTLEYNQNEKRKDEALKGERRRVLRKLNMAAVEGDREGYREALREIREYNKGLRGQARRKVILPETMLRSRRAFLQTTGRMRGGVEYTPNMLESAREYDQGLQLFNWD
ncbi:MAG: PLxRFG domain-containing protein, partial [Rhodospirillales bacterium]